jgi:hypothetical protein
MFEAKERDAMPHGRSEEDRDRMMEAGRNIMVHTARRQGWILYSDLNQEISEDAGTAPFDFSRDSDRGALGTLLADIVKADLLHSRFMLSSVVKLSAGDGPGAGFYSLGEHLGHLEPGASPDRKFEFWVEQLKLTHDHYKRRI